MSARKALINLQPSLQQKKMFCPPFRKKLHTETAKQMQSDIDRLLGYIYEETDSVMFTPGEVYLRLEWVDSLEQITGFIDEAYRMRLLK
jgi:DNA polymerase sigma